jgi:2-dehydro-3-deoxyphosphooctonate aldolase (KDO 8-P synthase)
MKRNHRKKISEVKLTNFSVGGINNPICLIAGPCVVEDEFICLDIIDTLSELCLKYKINYIFKTSFDKANKTISNSYRGPGWKEGLKKIQKIKSKRNIPIITDVHEADQCDPVSEICEILQIPALLSKQIDLILAAAKTGNAINIKKGQFTPPYEMKNVISRLSDNGYSKTMITDRGFVFGYGSLINDMRALQILSSFQKPVIFDGSHSVHSSSIPRNEFEPRDYIIPLTRSAVANGVDGIFIETHPQPEKALSDGDGTLDLKKMEKLIKEVSEIDVLISGSNEN